MAWREVRVRARPPSILYSSQCLQASSKPRKTPQLFRSPRVKFPPQLSCNLAPYFLVVLFLLSTSLSAAAQTAADQELQRQQERERVLRRQQEPQADVRLARPDDKISEEILEQETPCFVINHITLVGNEVERFDGALKIVTSGNDSMLGRCLGVGGINAVMSRVQNRLVAQGYVTTRILTQPQDLRSGTLTLTVVPGHVRAIRFADDANLRGTQWNAVPIASGDILNLRDIEQALENFKRVPTADADIKITPSTGDDAQPGDSDLVIQYQQAFPFRLTQSFNNSGSKATGKYMSTTTVSYDNWWTLNDLFYFSYNHDLGGGQPGIRGSNSYTVSYSIPFGYWTLSATSSSSAYHQTVAGTNQSYFYSGKSDSSDITLSRLIYRDAVRKTTLSFKTFLRRSSNFVDDTEVEPQQRRTAGWELGVAHREFIGSTTLELSVAYRRGTGAFSALPAPEQAFGEGSSRFTLATTDISLMVPFKLSLPWGEQNLRYNLSGRAQWNGTPLTPQDRFSIGGRYTVRGFDGEQTLLADHGWVVRNDLAAALGGSGQEVYVGLDAGAIGGPAAAQLVGTTLAGAVVGLRGSVVGVNVDVFVGTPISRPNNFVTSRFTAGFSLSKTF